MHLFRWLAKGVDEKVVVFAPESPFSYLSCFTQTFKYCNWCMSNLCENEFPILVISYA